MNENPHHTLTDPIYDGVSLRMPSCLCHAHAVSSIDPTRTFYKAGIINIYTGSYGYTVDRLHRIICSVIQEPWLLGFML